MRRPFESHLSLVLLIASVQFVNILDFMMVMPLGPDLAKELNIHPENLGIISGTYTAAGALSGLLFANILDQFNRRNALCLLLLGLSVATFMGALSVGFNSLILARFLAGFFGGPASALALAIISDVIPKEKLGWAIGLTFSGFSVASVLGVPAGLEMARLGGWKIPFFFTGILCFLITIFAFLKLPDLKDHMNPDRKRVNIFSLLGNSKVRWSLAINAFVMGGIFVIIPNIATFLQFNLGYPREKMGLLYFFGGISSFIVLQIGGRWIDRIGPSKIAWFSTIILCCSILFGFGFEPQIVSPIIVFIFFMGSNSLRNASCQQLMSRVPPPEERAQFQSLQSCIQHIACALGAFTGSMMLKTESDFKLSGMKGLVFLSIIGAMFVPFLLRILQQKVDLAPTQSL